MIKYKDTSKPAKPHHGAASGQNDHKAKVTFASIVNSMLTFLFLAGVLLLVTHCQPVQASNKLGNKITLFSEKSAENNIGMPQGTGNKNHLQSVAGVIDNKDLSKLNSGQASRYLLAFFVPEFWLASQAAQSKDTSHLTHFTGLNRHIMPALAASYGGVTLQNSPFWVTCRAVSVKTESEPRHPLRNFRSVALSQNLTGGHNHA